MDLKNLKIVPPEGMEWYQEGDEIKFRSKKSMTYSDIARKLFSNKMAYFTDHFGNVKSNIIDDKYCNDPNNCTSMKQFYKLYAINQLMNVAKYLNGDWQPNWNNWGEFKYYLATNNNRTIDIASTNYGYSSIVYFKSAMFAKQAVDILGEETIRLALCTDW